MTSSSMRILPSGIGPVIPVVDIADMIGYSRSAITKAIKDHEGKMSPCKTFIPLPTTGGEQQFLCLNRTGIDYLFLFIHPSKSRMNDDEFIDFRKTILDKTDNNGHAVTETSPDIRSELQQAKELAEVCGKPAEIFQAVVFKKHQMPEFAEVLQASGPITPSASERGFWMTPRDIGRECALSAQQVNQYLYNNNFQYPEGPIWRLTEKGEIYGEEFPFTTVYKHTEIRIRWHRSILVASRLKRPISENQLALPEKVCSNV